MITAIHKFPLERGEEHIAVDAVTFEPVKSVIERLCFHDEFLIRPTAGILLVRNDCHSHHPLFELFNITE